LGVPELTVTRLSALTFHRTFFRDAHRREPKKQQFLRRIDSTRCNGGYTHSVLPPLIQILARLPHLIPIARNGGIVPTPIMIHLMNLLRYVLCPRVWVLRLVRLQRLRLCDEDAGVVADEEDGEEGVELEEEVDGEGDEEEERNVDSWSHGGYAIRRGEEALLVVKSR
jgi:hypothetical protein